MCGILGVFGKLPISDVERRALLLKLSQTLRHRGPDWNGIYMDDDCVLCHERLAIVDPNGEAQPLYNEAKTIVLSVNGEIYNHVELKKKYCASKVFATASDCEPIAHMYEDMGPALVELLDGDFAFILADRRPGKNTFLAARDPMGVTTLYYGFGQNGSIWFASELKALKDVCARFYTFPPGHFYTPETGFVRYYNPTWMVPGNVPTRKCDFTLLRNTLIEAVRKRMMTDVPYGVLLSGGLDSSLVASIASRLAPKRQEDGGKSKAWWSTLHTFSIGLKGSSDLPFARRVADFLGTVHHEFIFTVQQGLDAIRDLIWHLETFDVTTIRASTPMYLLSRKIRAMGVKMVLSGEGSDEILAMNIDPAEKMHRHGEKDKEGKAYIEKYILRKAFDTPEEPFLPDDCLWRQKEQFSDGVGYSWIDTLKSQTEKLVSDQQMKTASDRWPHLPPKTKEAYYYREIFDSLFPQRSAEETVKVWIPTWSTSQDPSGRAQLVHEKTTVASK